MKNSGLKGGDLYKRVTDREVKGRLFIILFSTSKLNLLSMEDLIMIRRYVFSLDTKLELEVS